MPLMQLDIVSLFPAISQSVLSQSIIGRAQKRGIVTIRHIDLRDYSEDARGTVDDAPLGGGAGMLLKPEVLFRCMEDLRDEAAVTAYLCPQGRRFCQAMARDFSAVQHLILFCGHYEGIDERARQCLFDEEISLGDFVLTNGVIAASVVADAVIRLLPGVLGHDESAEEESFSDRELLEYPHFTRPACFRNMSAPQVLIDGDHEKVARWRKEQAVIRTAARRPDLLS